MSDFVPPTGESAALEGDARPAQAPPVSPVANPVASAAATSAPSSLEAAPPEKETAKQPPEGLPCVLEASTAPGADAIATPRADAGAGAPGTETGAKPGADPGAPGGRTPGAAGGAEDVHPVQLQSVGEAASDFAGGGEMLVFDEPAAAAAGPAGPVSPGDMMVVEGGEEEYSPTVVVESVVESVAEAPAEASARAAEEAQPQPAEEAQPQPAGPASAGTAEGSAGPVAPAAQAPAGEEATDGPTYSQQLAAAAGPGEAGGEAGGGESASVIIRYGLMRQLGQFRHALDRNPPLGTKVVIRTERGVELGTVVIPVGCGQGCGACVSPTKLKEFLQANGPDYPFRRDGKILRLANPQDVIDQRHLESSAFEEGSYCRQQIKELALSMRLVTVEHLLGGERIIFYFSSEQRVDFRELVRRLAQQYRTRIEMRQVGARDEARLVGDYERCGQRCCCQEFLKDLRPISMRMAKTQKATLDPTKISGRCGRLMCCLRYEDAVYEELRKKLPKKNIWVRTADVVARVIDTQILTQLVRLMKVDGTQVVVPNEEILERNVEPPPPPKEREYERRPPRDRSQMHPLRDEAIAAGGAKAAVQAGGPAATPAGVAAGQPAAAGAGAVGEMEHDLDESVVAAATVGAGDAGSDEGVAERPAGPGDAQVDADEADEAEGDEGQAEASPPVEEKAVAGGQPAEGMPRAFGGGPGAGGQGQGGEGRRRRRRRGRKNRGFGQEGAGQNAGGRPAGQDAGGRPAGQDAGGRPAGQSAGGQPAGQSAGGQGGPRPSESTPQASDVAQGGGQRSEQGGPRGEQEGRHGRRRRRRHGGGGGGQGGRPGGNPQGGGGGGGNPQGGGGGGGPAPTAGGGGGAPPA